MSTVIRLFQAKAGGVQGPRRSSRSNLAVESLEARWLLYATTGNAWPHPEVVTLSFMPDGTDLGGVASNMNAAFNANPRLVGKWQAQIIKAAQVWAQQTNLNIVVVPDNGAPAGSGDYQQGDPGFGDIRIGGFDFGSTTLGMATLPPPVNNYSIAGDVVLNTGQTWGINFNGAYDLFTVSTHEIGHTLGLAHSSVIQSEMYPIYTNIKPSLNADDVSGIRAIYSGGAARSHDAYNSGGASNGSFATAASLNSVIDTGTLTGLATGLDITTAGQSEYFKVNAPTGTNGTMTITMQSSGLSSLSPKITVYASNQTTILATASGLNQYGTTLTVSISGVTAGTQYYIKAQGADTTAFGTGAYAMTLDFGNNPSPTVPLPDTTTPNGSPLSAGGGMALIAVDTPGQEVFAANPAAFHKKSHAHHASTVHGAHPVSGARPWFVVHRSTAVAIQRRKHA